MVRVFEGDAERLNAQVSLVRLVEASGVRLEKRGKEHVGACPFHEDEGTSLVIATAENTWRCTGACGVGGDVIDWMMKRNGVSRHHAAQLLREGAVDVADSTPAPVKASSVRCLPSPLHVEADDQALLGQVVAYYHETLKQVPEALAFLQSRGLIHGELVERFRLGCANRTLGLRLPEKNRKAGAEIRSRLERIGIYRSSGHEHFNGSLIVPIFDERGLIVQVYGHKSRKGQRMPKLSGFPAPRPFENFFFARTNNHLSSPTQENRSPPLNGFRNLPISTSGEGAKAVFPWLDRGARRWSGLLRARAPGFCKPRVRP